MTNLIHSLALIFSLGLVVTESISQPIQEEKFISIGGIEQWVTIKGADKTRPAILFIHGGPGSVLSPYAGAIFKGWEKDFVLVNWDQRGAGRTFGKNAPEDVDEDYWLENPLSLDRMVADGIEVTEYLLKHLDKQKVILIGSSWGSALGAKMALQRPELFHAYIGHSQVVNFNAGLKFAYQKTYSLAKQSGDTTCVNKLESLGEPPYLSARDVGQLLQQVKKYESAKSTPAPAAWWTLPEEYNTEKDNKDRYNGDDYSFLYYAGHRKLGIKPMADNIDFNKDGLTFNIPVFLVQGELDILTAKEITRPYFEAIRAPKKEYFLLPDAAHGFNRSVTDQLLQILKEHVKPVIAKSKK